MLADTITPIRARAYALQGGLAMLVLVTLSAVNLNLIGTPLSFLFVPLILVYLWPRGADKVLSYCLLFGCGILFDVLTGTAIGFWALIFMTGLAVIQPTLMNREATFNVSWVGFITWMSIWAAILLGLNFISAKELDIVNFIIQICIAILVFPFVYAIRVYVRSLIISEAD